MSFKRSLSLPNQVILAALLGILVGIFFGDACKIFEPIGSMYTMLLQTVVYPYIIASLLHSLGRLAPPFSLKLWQRGWIYYVILVLLCFAVIYLLSLALPKVVSGLDILSANSKSIHLINMLIPSNVINALSMNYVPAVILFCVFFGIILQRIPEKSVFLSFLDTICATSLEFWKYLVKFAPLGTFALLANVAGTIHLSQLETISEYLFLFTLGSLLLTFWLLPIIICSLTDLKYRPLMMNLRVPLILSAATTLSVVALPYILKYVTDLFQRENVAQAEADEVAQTTLMISYPFAQLGNFFMYLFVMFATLYFGVALHSQQTTLLPLVSYLASIGSPSSSINTIGFLASWLQLPNDTATLYVGTMVVTRYLQVAVSVMGFSFMAILVTYAYFGRIRIQYKKIFTHLIAAFALLGLSVIAFKHFMPNIALKKYHYMQTLTVPFQAGENHFSTFLPADAKPPSTQFLQKDSLKRIQATGILRVGYNKNMQPFSYRNVQNDLVGFDVAFVYKLAKSLGVKLAFIPYNLKTLVDDIQSQKFDLAIGGLLVTPERLLKVDFSHAYFQSPIIFITNTAKAAMISREEQQSALTQRRIATPNDPVYIELAKKYFPNAQLVVLNNYHQELAEAFKNNQVDAALSTRISAYFWILENPAFVLVDSKVITTPMLMAYMVSSQASHFLFYLNYFMLMEKDKVSPEALYNNWVFGISQENPQNRWSIWKNVLGF